MTDKLQPRWIDDRGKRIYYPERIGYKWVKGRYAIGKCRRISRQTFDQLKTVNERA